MQHLLARKNRRLLNRNPLWHVAVGPAVLLGMVAMALIVGR